MSTLNKEHSKMGLPRASGGKRRWSGEGEGSGLPSKVICTSPPHALCAEDTTTTHLHHQAHASLSREVELLAPLTIKGVMDQTQGSDNEGTSVMLTSAQIIQEHSRWNEDDDVEEDSNDEIEEDDDDIDNEDDKDSDLSSKDSGFIDSNSIDNSSDDEENRATCLSSEASIPVTEESSETTVPSSTSLQLSLSKALTDSTCTTTSSETSDTYTQDCSTITSSLTTSTCSTVTTTLSLCSTNPSLINQGALMTEGSLTTVSSIQTGTVVTSAYQGSVTSHVYDTHSYPYPDQCMSRPATPGWGTSCNYYEQNATPKYMEIQPSENNKYMEIQSTATNKTGISQTIQCEENGKSYLELGSASPYTNTYNTNECGSYTTSPTTYPSQTYNQTYTSPSNFTQPGAYYNTRQSYSPNPYVYTSGETYTGYEGVQGENVCNYGYGGAGYGVNRTQATSPRQRCNAPYCDATRGISRPSCYNQQRLSVLNMSMYKLNRFRQFAEPSLHRSVLICNTLRHIERELESEGISVANLLSHQNGHIGHVNHTVNPPTQGNPQCHEPIPSPPPVSQSPSEGPLPPMHAPMVGSPLVGDPGSPVSMSPSTSTTQPTPSVSYHSGMSPSPTQYSTTGQYMPVDHPTTTYQQQQDATTHLRPYSPMEQGEHHEQSESVPISEASSEVETEVPSPSPSVKSPSIPSEERTDAINWCSVLSLSSQSDLDTMNNNEYSGWGSESSNSNMDYSRVTENNPSWKLPSLSADDVLKSFPEANKRLETNEDLDSIINVLVGS